MQSVLSRSFTPTLGNHSQNDQIDSSLPQLPEELYESFFSSPSLPKDCDDFADLDLAPLHYPDQCLDNFFNLQCVGSEYETSNSSLKESFCEIPDEIVNLYSQNSPASSTSTEPLMDPSDVYNSLTEVLNFQSVAHKGLKVSTDHKNRRKASHTILKDYKSDVLTYESSSLCSYSSSGSDTGFNSSIYQRKKSSNREAAHRYRQKVKTYNLKVTYELSETFKSMIRSKMSYEKALNSFTLLQRVVNDLTSL